MGARQVGHLMAITCRGSSEEPHQYAHRRRPGRDHGRPRQGLSEPDASLGFDDPFFCTPEPGQLVHAARMPTSGPWKTSRGRDPRLRSAAADVNGSISLTRTGGTIRVAKLIATLSLRYYASSHHQRHCRYELGNSLTEDAADDGVAPQARFCVGGISVFSLRSSRCGMVLALERTDSLSLDGTT